VCVLSSTAEGFSNSILEYMAASRPVVATDVGGAREAVVDGLTGYLVRMDDDKAMADRIIYLLRNSEVATAMGRSGRQVVEEKFSCEAQLEKIETLYDRLLKRTSPQVQLAPKRDSKISLESER
jgi:glycosyltransferase involved in cell wall biosynthesis